MNLSKTLRTFFYLEKRQCIEQFIIIGCLLIVLTILVLHLRDTGFTCDDDMFTATARFRWGGVWNAAWAMATGHGRFYHLFIYPIAQLPYLFSGFQIQTVAKMLSIVAVFATFFITVRSLMRSATIASLFTLLGAGLLTCSHMFNPVHALPLWFSLGMAVLLIAIFFFNEGLTKYSNRCRRLSGLFYFFALLYYETFFAYVVLFPILAFFRCGELYVNYQDRLRRAVWLSLPILVAASLWLIFWISFRAAYPPEYTGGELGLSRFSDMLKTVILFSLSGLNFSAIWKIPWKLNGWAITAALLSGIAFFLLLRKAQNRLGWNLLILIAVLGGFFALAPNLVFGFTPRYREWVKHDTYYLGSFYASFSLLFLVGAAVLSIQRLIRHQLASVATSLVLALAFAASVYANHLDAERFFRTHRINRQSWSIVEMALAQGMAEQLPTKFILVAPSLMRMPKLTPGAYDYWSYYMTQALGYPLQVVSTPNEKSQLPAAQRKLLPSFGLEKKLLGLSLSYSHRYLA